LIRLVGQPPIHATVYRLEKLRCPTCGKLFTARTPDEAGDQKYAPTVGPMIALMKYGSGLPFHRLERLQRGLGVPLPAGTQWKIVHTLAQDFRPVFDEQIRQAGQGAIVHNDAVTREETMTPQARLEFHQIHSGPVLETLHTWLKRQLDEHLVEANSGLGKAIQYLLKH
jgi:hypothetical protein